MPTPSEQKALAFIAIVILLGGAVRVVRAGTSAKPSDAEQQSLAAQTAAVDSATTRKSSGRRSKTSKSSRDTKARVAEMAGPDLRSPSERMGFPPPGPRIDIGAPPRPMNPGTTVRVGAVDLDVASVREIEALPRIGPSMAKKIVAHRDSFGPFRSVANLKKVKGMGDATIDGLRSRITFSGRAPDP